MGHLGRREQKGSEDPHGLVERVLPVAAGPGLLLEELRELVQVLPVDVGPGFVGLHQPDEPALLLGERLDLLPVLVGPPQLRGHARRQRGDDGRHDEPGLSLFQGCETAHLVHHRVPVDGEISTYHLEPDAQ